MSILTLGWIFVCFIAYNDNNDFNWKAFGKLNIWLNWYMYIIILSATLAIYCLLLLIISLILFAIREPLNLHWLHKILLFVSLIIVVLGTLAITFSWTEEWTTVSLSLQVFGPFLQLGAVVALTLISWFVFQSYNRAEHIVARIIIIGVLLAVSVVVYLSPLLIRAPCITDELPPKPGLVAHRGAPLLAPENTMMSFKRSMECNVTAFETDVQLSKDEIPFLMHDNGEKFLQRTTNVNDVFSKRSYNSSQNFTWKELKMLNAGEWFVKTDPFWSVSLLSEEQKKEARNETIPSLTELLELAEEHNIHIIFDLKDENDECNVTVTTIKKSGISGDLIWWLPSKCRENTSGFRQVYDEQSCNKSLMKDNEFLNVKYNKLRTEEISEMRHKNISINLWGVHERWLFSLLWCAGASSVTTNTCHLFKDMSKPDLHLAPLVYRIVWIAADILSFILMILFFIVQRKRKAKTQMSFHQKEQSPFLGSSL